MKFEKIIVKIISLTIFFIGVGWIKGMLDPLVKNRLAMEQMNIDILSNFWLDLYQKVSDFMPIIAILVVITVLGKDFITLLTEILKRKGENHHEEN